jgi:hypothetical protein
VPGVLAVSLVDGLWMLGDGQNRTLHDFAVDTRVISEPR